MSQAAFTDPLEMPDELDFYDNYQLSPRQRLVAQMRKLYINLVNQFLSLPLWQRALLVCAAMCCGTIGLLLLIFHNKIFHWLVEVSNDLHDKKSTQFILGCLIFIVGFPPLIGYSFLSTSTGLIYGVSLHGWLILSIASVTGSIVSFTVFQKLLKSKAEELVHSNKRFEAFSSILRENSGYWFLALLRLCPFPYSLTNGAIAGVHGITIRNFAIANIITTPKLFIYLFVGSKLKNIGETKSTNEKILDILSIIFTGVVFTVTAWLLYFKTQQRYQMLNTQQPDDDLEQFEL